MLLEMLTTINDPERSFLPWKGKGADNVVLLVNNLGGLSELELTAITAQAIKSLADMDIRVQRVLAGTYMVRILL